MRLGYICKLFRKEADVKSDMAQRMLYELSTQEERQSRYDLLEQTATQSVKKIIKYATMAAAYHATLFGHLFTPSSMAIFQPNFELNENTIKTVKNSLEVSLQKHNYEAENVWEKLIKITIHLLSLYSSFLKTDKLARKEKLLKEMLAYINVFDGMSHNRGSIFEWILYMESIEKKLNKHMKGMEVTKQDFYPERQSSQIPKEHIDESKKMLAMRDFQRKNDDENVLNMLLKHVDAKYPFQETISRIHQTYPKKYIDTDEKLNYLVACREVYDVLGDFVFSSGDFEKSANRHMSKFHKYAVMLEQAKSTPISIVTIGMLQADFEIAKADVGVISTLIHNDKKFSIMSTLIDGEQLKEVFSEFIRAFQFINKTCNDIRYGSRSTYAQFDNNIDVEIIRNIKVAKRAVRKMSGLIAELKQKLQDIIL